MVKDKVSYWVFCLYHYSVGLSFFQKEYLLNYKKFLRGSLKDFLDSLVHGSPTIEMVG